MFGLMILAHTGFLFIFSHNYFLREMQGHISVAIKPYIFKKIPYIYICVYFVLYEICYFAPYICM